MFHNFITGMIGVLPQKPSATILFVNVDFWQVHHDCQVWKILWSKVMITQTLILECSRNHVYCSLISLLDSDTYSCNIYTYVHIWRFPALSCSILPSLIPPLPHLQVPHLASICCLSHNLSHSWISCWHIVCAVFQFTTFVSSFFVFLRL